MLQSIGISVYGVMYACVCSMRVTSGEYFNKPPCIYSDNDFYSDIKSMSYYILYKSLFMGYAWHIICFKFHIYLSSRMQIGHHAVWHRVRTDILSTTFSVVVVVVVVDVGRFVDCLAAFHRERRTTRIRWRKFRPLTRLACNYHTENDETICWMSFNSDVDG